jgi:hypothetical protein
LSARAAMRTAVAPAAVRIARFVADGAILLCWAMDDVVVLFKYSLLSLSVKCYVCRS